MDRAHGSNLKALCKDTATPYSPDTLNSRFPQECGRRNFFVNCRYRSVMFGFGGSKYIAPRLRRAVVTTNAAAGVAKSKEMYAQSAAGSQSDNHQIPLFGAALPLSLSPQGRRWMAPARSIALPILPRSCPSRATRGRPAAHPSLHATRHRIAFSLSTHRPGFQFLSNSD